MANTPVVEAILLISSIIVSAAVSATVISKFGTMQATLSSVLEAERRNAVTRLEAVHAVCVGPSEFEVYVKNIGRYPVRLSEINILVGPPGGETPVWNGTNGQITAGGEAQGDTLPPGALASLNITLNNALSTSTVSIKLVYPNGATDSVTCSLG